MEVGEAAAAAAGEGALGAHIDFCHFCLSLATPPLPQLSLFTSLHVIHTWMRTREHTDTRQGMVRLHKGRREGKGKDVN